MKVRVTILFSVFISCVALNGMDQFKNGGAAALVPPVIMVITKDGGQFPIYERFLLYSSVLSSLRESQMSKGISDCTQLKLTTDHMSENFRLLAPLLCCQQDQNEKELTKSKKKKEKEATIDELQREALKHAAWQLHFNSQFCSALSSACDYEFKNAPKRMLRKLVVSTGLITKTFLAKLAEEEQKRHSV